MYIEGAGPRESLVLSTPIQPGLGILVVRRLVERLYDVRHRGFQWWGVNVQSIVTSRVIQG